MQVIGGGSSKASIGGWIADGYVAFTRLLPILCGCANTLLSHDTLGLREYKLMVQAAYVMIANLMLLQPCSPDELECHIKMLLSSVQTFVTTVWDITPTTNRFWFKGSNITVL
eukprot:7942445-Ditylum_brightwellii.AAC.1